MAQNNQGVSRRRFITSVAATGLLVGAGAQVARAQSEQPPRKGGRLRVGLNAGSAKDSLDAKHALTDADIARQNNLYDPLLSFNPHYQIEPALAETVEPSDKARVWMIRLRSGVQFHNGKSLTARDVAFTFEYLLDPKHAAPAAAHLSEIEKGGIEIVDDLTLRIRFKTSFSVFRDVLADLGSAGIRVIPEGYDPKNPIGTGPFKLQSFEPGVRSLFIRNENYWRDGEPYVDELEMINFTDDSARVNALLSGQVDAIANLPANQMRIIEANPAFKLINSQTGAWNPFTMRTDVAPFNDARVRQALRLLVNREQMVQQVLAGQGTVANDIFARYDPGYASDLPQREVDIDQAKSLLKQAGHEGFSAEIVTSPVSIGLVEAAEAFVQQASLAGVTLTLRQVEPATFFSQFFMVSPLSQSYWFTRNYFVQTMDSMLPNAAFNETHWSDEAWLKIVTEGFAEMDDGKRAELVSAAQTIENDRGGYINWGFYNRLDVVKANVEGVVPDKGGIALTSYSLRRAWFST